MNRDLQTPEDFCDYSHDPFDAEPIRDDEGHSDKADVGSPSPTPPTDGSGGVRSAPDLLLEQQSKALDFAFSRIFESNDAGGVFNAREERLMRLMRGMR